MTPPSMQARLARARDVLFEQKLDALVSFGAADCRYLTGFTGEAVAVVLTPTDLVLVTDSRFTTQAEQEAPGVRLVICGHSCDDRIPEILTDQGNGGTGPSIVGFDSEHLTVKRWDHLREVLAAVDTLEVKPVDALIGRCRLVKFADELDALRRAGKLVVEAFAYLESISVTGRTERDIALDLELFLRRNGSDGVAFPLIIASGPRSALPHGMPSASAVQTGDFLVVDMGAVVNGYASDMTRTYAIGTVDPELAEVYEVVRAAQAMAVSAIRPGVAAREVDEIARAQLGAAGIGDLFVHSLGHGVGLEVHEGPHLSTRSTDVLEAGMVVTAEPGAYLPGSGGIRIEDSVIVTSQGAEITTEWPRSLRVLGR